MQLPTLVSKKNIIFPFKCALESVGPELDRPSSNLSPSIFIICDRVVGFNHFNSPVGRCFLKEISQREVKAGRWYTIRIGITTNRGRQKYTHLWSFSFSFLPARTAIQTWRSFKFNNFHTLFSRFLSVNGRTHKDLISWGFHLVVCLFSKKII